MLCIPFFVHLHFLEVAFFKAMIGKNVAIQDALDTLARLSVQEERLVSATTLSVINEVLGELRGDAEGTE